MTPQLANGAGMAGAQKVNFASEVPRSRRNGGNRSEKLQVRRSTISWQASRVSSPIQSLEKAFGQFSSLSSRGGECILSQVGKLQARCFVTGGRHSRLMHLCGEMHKTPPVVVNGGGRAHLERGDDEPSGEGGS